MSLNTALPVFWLKIQKSLFPWLKDELGPLTEKQQHLVTILELLHLEKHIRSYWRGRGRPEKDRVTIARAFVAKSVYDMPTTRVLIERLCSDISLRRICGFEKRSDIPSESVFSRAFEQFAKNELPGKVHETLIRNTQQDRLVGHISRDSTAIEGREKPLKRKLTIKTSVHADVRRRAMSQIRRMNHVFNARKRCR
jgi:transposase